MRLGGIPDCSWLLYSRHVLNFDLTDLRVHWSFFVENRPEHTPSLDTQLFTCDPACCHSLSMLVPVLSATHPCFYLSLSLCVCLCWQHGLPFVWCCCSSSWLFYCLPVILLLDSPWPLLLCSRKKSLLLSVTQSFSTFLSRTSSGFSHISSNREGPEWALCRLGLCNRGEV